MTGFAILYDPCSKCTAKMCNMCELDMRRRGAQFDAPPAHYLRIETKLPSLNEYIDECRKHWSRGARFKKNTEEAICWYIRKAKREGTLSQITGTVNLTIVWHEKTCKRDTDNIQSASKYILDALQTMGIIKNDSPKYVDQISHRIERGDADFVEVYFYEARTQEGK